MMSAPARLLRSRATFVLYCSSSTPDGWKFTVTLTPLAFCCCVNVGMTYLVYQSASSAFLPPAIAFEVIVRVTSLAPAFWVGLAPVEELRSQAAAPTTTSDEASATRTVRRSGRERGLRTWLGWGFTGTPSRWGGGRWGVGKVRWSGGGSGQQDVRPLEPGQLEGRRVGLRRRDEGRDGAEVADADRALA